MATATNRANIPHGYFPRHRDTLQAFFALDKAKIRSVINAFNKDGTNVTFKRISELTGFSPGSGAISIRNALAYMVHNKIHHDTEFQKVLEAYDLGKDTVTGLVLFLEGLEKKAKDALDVMFWVAKSANDSTILTKVESKTVLTEVKNDEDKFMAYLPLVRVRFDFKDEDGKTTSRTTQVPVDNFQSLIATLEAVHKEAKNSAKEYKKKLGDSVLYSEDE